MSESVAHFLLFVVCLAALAEVAASHRWGAWENSLRRKKRWKRSKPKIRHPWQSPSTLPKHPGIIIIRHNRTGAAWHVDSLPEAVVYYSGVDVTGEDCWNTGRADSFRRSEITMWRDATK